MEEALLLQCMRDAGIKQLFSYDREKERDKKGSKAVRVKKPLRIIAGTALILSVSLVAMLFTDEVKWEPMDFAIIGTLLIGTGLLFELITTRVNPKYRGVIAVVLVAALLLVWAELAVGIFGTPLAGS